MRADLVLGGSERVAQPAFALGGGEWWCGPLDQQRGLPSPDEGADSADVFGEHRPAHAPMRTQIDAPENHVTSASATPKNPDWSSFRVTTLDIQTAAENP